MEMLPAVGPPATPAVHKRVDRGVVRRFSTVQILVVLLLWLGAWPFVLQLPYGGLIEILLVTAVMLSAVVAVGVRVRTLVLAIAIVAPASTCRWINYMRPDLIPMEFHAVGAGAILAFVGVQFLRFILRAPCVDAAVVSAGLSVYLMMGLFWAFVYLILAELVPGSFTFVAGPAGRQMIGLDAVYYSFVTLSTIGYGDIIPASYPARMLSVLEATTGLFYVTVLLARLVSLYSNEIAHSAPLRSRSRSRRPTLARNYGTARGGDDLMVEMNRTNEDHAPS